MPEVIGADAFASLHLNTDNMSCLVRDEKIDLMATRTEVIQLPGWVEVNFRHKLVVGPCFNKLSTFILRFLITFQNHGWIKNVEVVSH